VSQFRPSVALLLEDEPLIALSVEDALQEVGFSPQTCVTCMGAEAWLASNTPVVAILDMSLSDGYFIAVAQALSDRRVPFIVHSGHEISGNNHDPIFDKGVWIAKPALPHDVATVPRALADSRLSGS
jgi:DNA-binding response OmpR family regulator